MSPVQTFPDSGFAILPLAVDSNDIDRYLAGLQAADPATVMMLDHKTGVRSYHSVDDHADLRVPLNRLIETHWAVPAARGLFSAPVMEFLQQAFRCDQLLCFETFHHEVGLGMRMHREGWYVSLRDGAPFASVWIALADIDEGGGELQYAPGSHLLPGFADPREEIVNRFGLECATMGIRRFTARKGDVLIASGDLGIGGDSVTDECRMFVAHFCALRDEPAYFAKLAPEFRVKRQLTRELYSSTVYAGKY
jgi:phytanoyl-CoA hydroxylase